MAIVVGYLIDWVISRYLMALQSDSLQVKPYRRVLMSIEPQRRHIEVLIAVYTLRHQKRVES
ncbi:hypothetical protein ACJJIQ_04600 [Microbulbifer sp. ANSA003]|uniref:hypothetical protein n=1 Tax=Microbulbifer sp. ANSA003 TaxID=3243360 RepID=UPI0040427550